MQGVKPFASERHLAGAGVFRHTTASRRVAAAVAALALAASGCGGRLSVTSRPSHARILIDGKDTGGKTPDTFRSRVLPSGEHTITVAAEGYAEPPPQTVETSFSFGRAFWSLFIPPIFITNLFRGFSAVEPDSMHFELVPLAATPAQATGTPQTPAPAPAPAPRPSTGVERYEGERQRLSQPGIKCAALPMRTRDVSEGMGLVLDDFLLTELQMSGFEAVGSDDLSAMLDFEAQKDALACDDAACMVELGRALGVSYLVVGNVARLGNDAVLTLKLIDVQAARVLARVNNVAAGGENVLPRIIGEAVRDLVKRSGL